LKSILVLGAISNGKSELDLFSQQTYNCPI